MYLLKLIDDCTRVYELDHTNRLVEKCRFSYDVVNPLGFQDHPYVLVRCSEDDYLRVYDLRLTDSNEQEPYMIKLNYGSAQCMIAPSGNVAVLENGRLRSFLFGSVDRCDKTIPDHLIIEREFSPKSVLIHVDHYFVVVGSISENQVKIDQPPTKSLFSRDVLQTGKSRYGHQLYESRCGILPDVSPMEHCITNVHVFDNQLNDIRTDIGKYEKNMRFISQEEDCLCCYSLTSTQLTFYERGTKKKVKLDAAPDRIIYVEQAGTNRLFIFSGNGIESTDHTGTIYEYKNKIGSGHYIVTQENGSKYVLIQEIADGFVAREYLQVTAVKGSVPVICSSTEKQAISMKAVAKMPAYRSSEQPFSKSITPEQATFSFPRLAALHLDRLVTKQEILQLQQVYLIEFYQRLNKCLSNNKTMIIEIRKSKLHRSTLVAIVSVFESDPRYDYVRVDRTRKGFVKLSYRD